MITAIDPITAILIIWKPVSFMLAARNNKDLLMANS